MRPHFTARCTDSSTAIPRVIEREVTKPTREFSEISALVHIRITCGQHSIHPNLDDAILGRIGRAPAEIDFNFRPLSTPTDFGYGAIDIRLEPAGAIVGCVVAKVAKIPAPCGLAIINTFLLVPLQLLAIAPWAALEDQETIAWVRDKDEFASAIPIPVKLMSPRHAEEDVSSFPVESYRANSRTNATLSEHLQRSWWARHRPRPSIVAEIVWQGAVLIVHSAEAAIEGTIKVGNRARRLVGVGGMGLR